MAAAGQRAGVAVPTVVAVDAGGDVVPGGYLVLSERPGRPWPALAPPPGPVDRDELRAEVGRQVAAVHTITGSGFGYPTRPLLLTAGAPALDEVQTAVLVHFDLWDGNILVEPGRGAPRIGGPDRRRARVLG